MWWTFLRVICLMYIVLKSVKWKRRTHIKTETHCERHISSTLREVFVQIEGLNYRPSWKRPKHNWKWNIHVSQSALTLQLCHKTIFPHIFHDKRYDDARNIEQNGAPVETGVHRILITGANLAIFLVWTELSAIWLNLVPIFPVKLLKLL